MLRNTAQKVGFLNMTLKFFMPAQGLPQMPRRGLNVLNASTVPNMGIYAKQISSTMQGMHMINSGTFVDMMSFQFFFLFAGLTPFAAFCTKQNLPSMK